MSGRKLQQEMDRVFKRVAEGVLLFDGIYDKLQMSTNQSQKEKLEQDLKRELKKLQKLRDQIKTWISSNEVRDKKQLMEQRRLIETEMERFKVVEREVKTKAYSREGLNRDKADPHEKEKRETTDFLQAQIDELESQSEGLETELDSLQGTTKKSKKDSDKETRISEIEHTLERHKWHIEKMEIMIRMIDNDTLAPESVNDLQDDILYYVESNQELDFAEDEEIYDELNLVDDDEDELVETIVRDDTYTLEDLAQDLSKEAAIKEKEREKEREKEKEQEKEKEPTPSPTPAAQPLPKIAPTIGHAPGQATLKPAKSASPQAETSASAKPMPVASHSGVAASQEPPSRVVERAAARPKSDPPVSNQPQATAIAEPKADVRTPALPSSLQDLVSAFDGARARRSEPLKLSAVSDLIEASFVYSPDSNLADRPSNYHPESPYPTPDYYPYEVLSSVENPAVFGKMDVDTLFYIFYYRQGSYQQYFAARELKSRSWRFHKRFLTWFQRHEEPQTINAEFEQGTYRFFDFEGSWLQRRKSSFKFEYQYLEDEV